MRVVEGLEPSTLQWLSGFAAGVAHERASGGRAESPWRRRAPRPARRPPRDWRSCTDPRPATASASPSVSGVPRRRPVSRYASMPPATTRSRTSRRSACSCVVMSTHGDGDPPDDARSFIEFIGSKRAPKLEQLSYSTTKSLDLYNAGSRLFAARSTIVHGETGSESPPPHTTPLRQSVTREISARLLHLRAEVAGARQFN